MTNVLGIIFEEMSKVLLCLFLSVGGPALCILHINVCVYVYKTCKYCHLVIEYLTVVSLPFPRHLHIPLKYQHFAHCFSKPLHRPPLTGSCWVGNTIKYPLLAVYQPSNSAWKWLSFSFQTITEITGSKYKCVHWGGERQFTVEQYAVEITNTARSDLCFAVYDELSSLSDCLVKIQQNCAIRKACE